MFGTCACAASVRRGSVDDILWFVGLLDALDDQLCSSEPLLDIDEKRSAHRLPPSRRETGGEEGAEPSSAASLPPSIAAAAPPRMLALRGQPMKSIPESDVLSAAGRLVSQPLEADISAPPSSTALAGLTIPTSFGARADFSGGLGPSSPRKLGEPVPSETRDSSTLV